MMSKSVHRYPHLRYIASFPVNDGFRPAFDCGHLEHFSGQHIPFEAYWNFAIHVVFEGASEIMNALKFGFVVCSGKCIN